MKIAMFVAKDAALKRGSDTYGWRIADVPAVSISEQNREFLIAYCKPEKGFEAAHDYAVRPMINPCSGSSRHDVEMPPAPDGRDIAHYTGCLIQYLSTCRELVDKTVAAYKAEQAQEKAETDVRLVSEKKKYETLAVRVLAGEFSDECFVRDSRSVDVYKYGSDYKPHTGEYDSFYRCDSEIVDKAFDYVDAAVKRFRVVLEAREAKEAADVAEHLAKKKNAIKTLLIKHGTTSQTERWEAGCLPEEELNEIFHNIAHYDLRDWPRYVKMTEDDIEHVEDCNQEPDWSWFGVDDETDSVTDKAWEKAKAIRVLLPPGVDNRIRLHKAHCRAKGCDTETRKYALQVRINIPDVGTFAREYELDGMFKVQL